MELLTVGDAARILETGPDGVRYATEAGTLVLAASTPSGMRLYRRADVEALKRVRDSRKPGRR